MEILLILGILVKETIGSERLSSASKLHKRCIDYFMKLCPIQKSETVITARTIRR